MKLCRQFKSTEKKNTSKENARVINTVLGAVIRLKKKVKKKKDSETSVLLKERED